MILLRDKKSEKKRLEKECMKLWAEIVKVRAKGVCEYPNCNRRQNLNAHHLFTRAKNSTRYDLDNGICLCSYHHTLGAEGAHRDPEFKEIIVNAGVRTEQFFKILRRKAFTAQKLDLKLELLYLKKEREKYDNK